MAGELNPVRFLGPEALIVLPLALTLDAIGIVLVCFGLDDFFITDIIGWSTLGVWSMFRSQVRETSASVEMPQGEKTQAIRNLKKAQVAAAAAEKKVAEETAKTAAKTTEEAGKTAKAGKWAKWIRFLEFVPWLGALPFWTISTFFILKEE